jgi:hypothetical protein
MARGLGLGLLLNVHEPPAAKAVYRPNWFTVAPCEGSVRGWRGHSLGVLCPRRRRLYAMSAPLHREAKTGDQERNGEHDPDIE